jgi:hypothetical protein
MGINATKKSSAKKAPTSTEPRAVRKRTGVARAVYELSAKARREGWINSSNTLRQWRKKVEVCIKDFSSSANCAPAVDSFLCWCGCYNCIDQGVSLIKAVAGNRLDRELAGYATNLISNPHGFTAYVLGLLSHKVSLGVFNPRALLMFIEEINFGLPSHEKIRAQIIEFFLIESDYRLEYSDLELLLSCANTEEHSKKIMAELVAHELAGDANDEY